MKHISKNLLGVLTLILLLITQTTQAQNYFPSKPEPGQYVNDFAGFMGSTQIKKLEDKLRAYKDSTSTQIVIVTVKNLAGKDIKTYSIHLASEWGIGQKGADNGILILASKQERKVRIEVGYGLEAKITDALAKQIINHKIVPNFKKENFRQGLEEGIDIITSVIAGEVFEIEERKKKPKHSFDYYDYLYEHFWGVLVIIVVLIILVIWALKKILVFLRNLIGACLNYVVSHRNRFKSLKEYLDTEKWDELKEKYKPHEVTEAQENYQILYQDLNKSNRREVSDLYYKVFLIPASILSSEKTRK